MGGTTHEVTNQPPPLEGHNLFESDPALTEAVRREGASWAEPDLVALGKLAGTAEILRLGDEANGHPPVLRTHDRYGHRIDEVEFHPAWHRLLALSVSHGIHALPWREPRDGAHAARAAMMIVVSEVEAGHGCPVSMTYAAVPALRFEPEIAAEWEPRLTSLDYDARLAPPADKAGALCGMAMTEKQGGSDVRSNTTRAEPLSAPGEYALTGHKWFCSAPMSDAFLVLAQAPGGLTCFLLPRLRPDGARNGFRIQRLKDKLGNRSNASAEIELERAWARRVGEEGRGVPTIVEMVNHTRLDCALGSTGLLRRAAAEAIHHAAHRSAFGRLLIDQPLMRNVLADLCVEAEAATLTAMRLARAVDEAEASEEGTLFKRLAVAVGKYWVCKRTVGAVSEALECLGGNGYVEESGLPRLYRETPLNSIWEGSGNIIALDVLRIRSKTPEALDAFLAEADLAAGADRRLDDHVAKVRRSIADGPDLEGRARRIAEDLALALQGSLVVRHAPPAVADAFCASRLGEDRGRTYGTLPAGIDTATIVDRHRPPLP
ncbi:MAG TPA: isovaleryl-CoA dehydrogenase [Actinomycetota bacterium]|nr:isovaleryl-CoA dehydrogenase [Actinomycetota bacterium]